MKTQTEWDMPVTTPLCPGRDIHTENPEQLRYRLDHKRLCYERAVERGDIHDIAIYWAQTQYLERELHWAEQMEGLRLRSEAILNTNTLDP